MGCQKQYLDIRNAQVTNMDREVTDVPDDAEICGKCSKYASAVYATCCGQGVCGVCYHDDHYLYCQQHMREMMDRLNELEKENCRLRRLKSLRSFNNRPT